MKIRFRDHELTFVTILAASQVIIVLSDVYYQRPGSDVATRFAGTGISFDAWRNWLLPQIFTVLLFYLCYLCISRLIVPLVKKISFTDFEKLITFHTIRPVVAITTLGFLLALGANAISWYGRPHLFHYDRYQLLAWLGYNDKPLSNIFFGFDRAVGLVILGVAVAGVRELIIRAVEKSGSHRAFRVLLLNTVTPLLFIYLLVPFIINPVNATFRDYLAWATPALVLYIYETFWFFPYKEGRGWLEKGVVIRLLSTTLAGALFFAVVFAGGEKAIAFVGYWLFLIFVVTSFSWLLYHQRKDKILQLKQMEAALARSATDLQFLRSQINPHFLFNALNTLYGTALRERSVQTAEGIQMLGDMMRFMLHENHLDLIPMEKETAYLKNYIALQKLRIPPSPEIQIVDNIGEGECVHFIAPMLFIPLVENAFKHGISLQQRSWIHINLLCDEAAVRFEVRNSIHSGLPADTEKDRSGIGLKNVTDRLRLLYAGRHELSLVKGEQEFVATLRITLKQ